VRRMSCRDPSSTTIRWTEGGATWKNRCMSASAGARRLSLVQAWMKARYWPYHKHRASYRRGIASMDRATATSTALRIIGPRDRTCARATVAETQGHVENVRRT
jgi:hypothetical protein